MKQFKIIPAITFVVILVSYLAIFNTYSSAGAFDELTPDEAFGYAKLSEEEKIAILNLPQDSLEFVASSFSDSTLVALQNVAPKTYQGYQDKTWQLVNVSSTMFSVKRLILALFILISGYLGFTKKLNYTLTFQKALFENVKYAVLFTLFSICAIMVTQMMLGTMREFSQMIQILLGELKEDLKYGIMYSILIAAFLYFHPHNQERLKQKTNKG